MKITNKIINKNLLKFLIIIIFCLNYNQNIYKIKGNLENTNRKFTFKKIKTYFQDKIKNNKKEYNNDNDIDDIFYFKPVLKLNAIKDNTIEIMYNYNIKGQLIEKKYIKENKFYEYNYDDEDKNKIIYKKCKNSFNDIGFLNTYEYNNKNQVIFIGNKNKQNQIQTKYKYNKKGQKIKKINIQNSQTSYMTKNIFKYKYNEKGQKIQKINYGIASKRTNKFFKFINEFTNINTDKFNKINKVLCTYKYNEKGQKIKKIDKKGNIYSYKYFDFTEL